MQVSAFRSRPWPRSSGAAGGQGFDAYVFPSITEDGRPRYRVRVGPYPEPERRRARRRGAAERAGLNPW